MKPKLRWAFAIAFALVMLAMSLGVSTKDASGFSCALPNQCLNDASCSGQYYTRSGCSIQCYNDCGGGGQICPGPSATCSTAGGPGGFLD